MVNIFWLIQLPFVFISLTAEDMLAFLAKAIIVPPTWFALLIWAFVKVLPNSGILAQKAKLWQCALMGLAERAQ